ncbi:hypothetical protein QRD43_20600 [Pelomonas sp. APW6]|uniref:Uncharacterized protein n=1 Tax=Roseateles subflavus TaxID=3053353 RepID=A0ABT7LPD7_9BURK|nr:hypothetical protein [Pelomonas sp. APW6]MDL5034314.1 hypothetical protein [Pelomonas sp. APW6]
MSFEAEAVVLFAVPMRQTVVESIRARAGVDEMWEVDDADLHCWVSESRQLEYCDQARSGPLLGEASLQGRLWRVSLGGRYWAKGFESYGGMPEKYRRSLTILLAEPCVVGVWYGTAMLSDDGPALSEHVDLRIFDTD